MKNIFVSLTIIPFLLAACSPAIPTPDQSATPGSTLESTAIFRPTYTKPAPAPTLNPNEIASRLFSDLNIEKQTLFSPDGLCSWERLLAWPLTEKALTKYGYQFFVRVNVSCVRPKTHEEVNWVLVNEWQEQNLGYSIPDLLGWSADGNTLYFHDSIIPDGCQPIGGFQENFRQVDLSTGNITLLFSEMRSGASLSPDTTRIVYYDMQNMDVGVYTLLSGEVQHIPFSIPEKDTYWDVGDFTWSPDGQRVLFVLVSGDACFPSAAYIMRMDVTKGEIKIVLTNEGQYFSILEWVEPTRVLISVGQEQKTLDPFTGTLY